MEFRWRIALYDRTINIAIHHLRFIPKIVRNNNGIPERGKIILLSTENTMSAKQVLYRYSNSYVTQYVHAIYSSNRFQTVINNIIHDNGHQNLF